MAKVEMELRGSVAIVTLNRPETLNALDSEAHEQLAAIWRDVKSRTDIRAVVITGKGRGFCVGMDLKAVGNAGQFRKPPTEKAAHLQTMTPLANDIWLPTIVAINGVCAGGGLHFVADADIVIAADTASFADPHVTYGQVAALEPISLIPRIGLGNSLRLALLGRAGKIDAKDALRICLVDELVPAEELLDRAIAIAEAISLNSPAAVERTKRAIWESLDMPLREAMQNGWESLLAHREHPDALEGPKSFAERRPPVWTTIAEAQQ